MAHRPQGYGLSRELALKTAGKYSDSDEVKGHGQQGSWSAMTSTGQT